MTQHTHPTATDNQHSQQLVIDVFMSFRDELMQSYGTINHVSKDDLSPVTELDVKIETRLKQKLLTEFPMFGFKGEETEHVEGVWDATWYIDPIDSTSSFIHGLPYCSNMAALVVGGEVVASVIYLFASDELFVASKGQGATKNGQLLSIKELPLEQSIVFGDAYSHAHFYMYFAPHHVQLYAPVGATGYFLTLVAQGSIQGVSYFKAKLKPHDVAPGMLLIREAGGTLEPLDSSQNFTHETRQFVAGAPNICRLLKQSLRTDEPHNSP